jgi:SAM-dependent methyltransferase
MSLQKNDPYGTALREYAEGNTAAVLVKQYSWGAREERPVDAFFRKPDFYLVDSCALKHCKGRVLDVGAGCGQHSLLLKHKGHDVTSIDILPESVEIMKSIGLSGVRQISFLEMTKEEYDTILMLGRSMGLCETLEGLVDVLKKCNVLIKSDGQILLGSLDFKRSPYFINTNKIETSKYHGEVRFKFVYDDIVGEEIQWLYVDSSTLSQKARMCGLETEVLCEEEGGDYLARLTISA